MDIFVGRSAACGAASVVDAVRSMALMVAEVAAGDVVTVSYCT